MQTTAEAAHADLIYDVGLHVGEDSDFYLKKGFKVVAIEANPDLAKVCREKFRDEIGQGRFTLIEGAIADPTTLTPGQTSICFYRSRDRSSWGSVSPDWNAS